MGGSPRNAVTLDVDGRQVTVSHPERVVLPAVSKFDLIGYYLSVAEGTLRGVAGRPMILKRFVKGISEEAVFQKRAPANRPDWVGVAELHYASGSSAAELIRWTRAVPASRASFSSATVLDELAEPITTTASQRITA